MRPSYLELAINEAWLPRISHKFSSCSGVVFRWGVFAIFQLKISFFNWWWRNNEPFLSYVFLGGVSIIRDQFVWEKKACHWLLLKLEQMVFDQNFRHFFTFREGDIMYLFQKCSNAFGNYIVMTKLKAGGHRRLVIILEGKVMYGCRGFDFEL